MTETNSEQFDGLVCLECGKVLEPENLNDILCLECIERFYDDFFCVECGRPLDCDQVMKCPVCG